jgi:hypothetical protein
MESESLPPLLFSRMNGLDRGLHSLISEVKKTTACHEAIANIIITELTEMRYEISRTKTRFGSDAGDDEENYFAAVATLVQNFSALCQQLIEQIDRLIREYNLTAEANQVVYGELTIMKEILKHDLQL